MGTDAIALIVRDWLKHHDSRRQGTHLNDRQEGLCSSCGSYIVWVRTERGKVMPLDPWADDGGRFCVRNDFRDASGRRVVHYVRDEELEGNTRPLYRSHFETCDSRNKPRNKPINEEKDFL